MSGNFIGLLMFAALMGFLVYRVHIGIAMFIVGAGGYLAMYEGNWSPLIK